MKVKKVQFTIGLMSLMGLISFSAGGYAAENTTVSLSFVNSHANIKIGGFSHSDNLHGLNLKYRYELNEHFGVMTSLLRSKITYNFKDQGQKIGSAEATYYSFTAGPSYRLNQYISVYALGGVGHSQLDGKVGPFSSTLIDNTFTAGTGLQFNLTKNLSLDTHYEYAKFRNLKVNTWTAGVGYRF